MCWMCPVDYLGTNQDLRQALAPAPVGAPLSAAPAVGSQGSVGPIPE
jgi:hypothetical protein